MNCEHCKERQANVTVTQVVNGQKSEKHYCEVCAQKFHPFNLDFHKEDQIPIQQLVSNLFGLPVWNVQEKVSPTTKAVNSCPSCGWTFKKFLNEGKLGCTQCYETFNKQLPQVLAKIQAGIKHNGKAPGKPLHNNDWIKNQVNLTRQKLQMAINEERFEDAAIYRDEIKDLERKLERGGVDLP